MKILKVLFFVAGAMATALASHATEAVRASSDPIIMPEYKVSGLDKQITVSLQVSKAGLVLYAVITQVAPGTPAEAAGLTRGMGIFKLQGVYVDGVTPKRFDELLGMIPKGDEILVSVVTSLRHSNVKEYTIPVKRIVNAGHLEAVAVR